MTEPTAGRLAALERVVALLGRLALPETPRGKLSRVLKSTPPLTLDRQRK